MLASPRSKYPNAPFEWPWQWVFRATRHYVDAETGEKRRHHLHESVVQRAVKDAARAAGIARPATCHSLRHYAGSRTMPSDGRSEFGVGPKLPWKPNGDSRSLGIVFGLTDYSGSQAAHPPADSG